VLTHGCVAFHGPPNRLSHWFSAETPEEIYQNLAATPPEAWHRTWRKNHGPYYRKLKLPPLDESWIAPAPPPTDIPAPEAAPAESPDPSPILNPQSSIPNPHSSIPNPQSSLLNPPSSLPSAFAQFSTLFSRRVRLFFRERGQLLLHLLLLLGFPCLVVIFAAHGVPPMPKRLDFSEVRTASDYLTQTRLIEQQVKTGSLISSLVLMQVILLALVGTNNAAREIAGERMLFEKEKLGGVGPGAYVLSKLVFLAGLVGLQSLWMGCFVQFFCRLPGDLSSQLLLLVGINAAMTFLCLGLSSLVRSPEQASLLGIYLAGFQLPLSGAVLRLPEKIEPFVRPFISAYWSWAGQLETMKPSDSFVGIRSALPTTLVPSWEIALWVLAAHAFAGLWIAWVGCRRHGWE
jgi:ABC transport system ATP-binding/permease protein